jgi:hypothetical protein
MGLDRNAWAEGELMAVYFIRAGEDGPVKIGYATNPRKRFAVLQSGHWMNLVMLRVIEGDHGTERDLHARYKPLHIRGEWYNFCPSMLSSGREASRAFIPRESWPLVRQAIQRAGGCSKVAREVGLSRQAVHQWACVPTEHAVTLSRLSGIGVEDLYSAKPEGAA